MVWGRKKEIEIALLSISSFALGHPKVMPTHMLPCAHTHTLSHTHTHTLSHTHTHTHFTCYTEPNLPKFCSSNKSCRRFSHAYTWCLSCIHANTATTRARRRYQPYSGSSWSTGGGKKGLSQTQALLYYSFSLYASFSFLHPFYTFSTPALSFSSSHLKTPKTQDSSLVPRPHAPPGEKRSGQQSQISWACYPKLVMTNEIVRSVIIT